MSVIYRIYVEKKKGFDVEAKQMAEDLKFSLGLPGLQDVRLFNRYDLEGLTAGEVEQVSKTILSEQNADNTFTELPALSEYKVFAVQYLPGQYDQRADSAAQCIALLTGGEQPRVQSARVIAVKGNINDTEFQKIKNYIINPVEAKETDNSIPETLEPVTANPDDIEILEGFCNMDSSEAAEFHRDMGLAMSVADLKFCRDYFRDEEKRDPSLTEIRVIDTYWSDHCRHTTFLTELENIDIEDGPLSGVIEEAWREYVISRAAVYGERRKNITLMDMATIGTKVLKSKGFANDLDESDEINACSINADVEVDGKLEQWLIQFKNETHNHPTEIEPFGGAATCLGGAIRDPLSGRAYVYQAMRVTGSGDPLTPFEKTIKGKLSQKKITTEAAKGYSSYGNQIGLATGQVSEIYDEGYVAKRMEIGAVIGASPKKNVQRGVPQEGDVIVLLGGRTGRDGCGGATGSSKSHNTQSSETCGAEVQKGNPPTERKLQRLFRNADAAKMIIRCNDFGAGGVCVAIGELADGLEINLDAVSKKYMGLDGTELAISESQERMAVVLKKEDVEQFYNLAKSENLEATAVASVSKTPRLIMKWRGNTIVDISRDFLNTNGVTQKASAKVAAFDKNSNYRENVPSAISNLSRAEALKHNLSRLEVCSQKGLAERFDSSIGAATVLMPFAGKYQLTPEGIMAAKVPVGDAETDTATAMSYGFIPGISKWSPFHSSVFAVTQSLAKLAAQGADPFTSRLTFQEYFERLGNEPVRWGKPVAALLGALTAQLNFKVPSIGGKDSMSGSFNEMDVPPTLVSFAVTMTNASEIVSSSFKKSGSTVVLLPLPIDESTQIPSWNEAAALFAKVRGLVLSGNILSASVVDDGGSAANVCKMAFGEKFGFIFNDSLQYKDLFAPLCGSFVAEVKDLACLGDIEFIELGTISNGGYFEIDSVKIHVEELVGEWTGKLESVFPTKAAAGEKLYDVPEYNIHSNKSPAIKIAKPRVIIPVFPGTNCEYDTAKAFRKAGADAQILVIRNLTAQDIEESTIAFAKAIGESQILMLPGGFSGGDEPDGSGKFIATTLRNKRISEALMKLLEQRDGLVLGICNGFQALIKTGLVPYGKITEIKEDDPTLTFNNIGRHVSQMAYTKITSVKSPWFSGVNAGDIFAVPVSHGEGRFAANDDTLKALIENNQIATQYVDADGCPTAEVPFNPNGSALAIEGITSKDGRILGKMAHSERKGENLYKNIPFNKDMLIFESGVKYFK